MSLLNKPARLLSVALLLAATNGQADTPIPATAEGDQATENSLHNVDALSATVPGTAEARRAELQALDHLKAKVSRVADIERSLAQIREDQKKGAQSDEAGLSTGDYIAQQVHAAMAGTASASIDGIQTGAPVAAPVERKKKQEFTDRISLIALWNPDNITAEVTVNQQPKTLQVGSMINGWKVTRIERDYLAVQMNDVKQKVFYTDGQ